MSLSGQTHSNQGSFIITTNRKPSKDSDQDRLAAAYAQALAVLADAQEVLAQRQDSLTSAGDDLEALTDRRARGDDTVTARQVRDASDEVEHLTALVAAAEYAVARAVRLVPNVCTELAEALVETVREALGVPVTVTTLQPAIPTDLPAAFLVQKARRVGDSITGTIGGDLEVVFYRQSIHKPLSVEAVERVAQSQRINLTARADGSSDTEGVLVDRARLTVVAAHSPVPILRAMTTTWPESQFAQGIAGQVRLIGTSFHGPTTGVVMGTSGVSGGRASVVGALTATGAHVLWTADTTDAQGVRRRVLTLPVGYWPMKGCTLAPHALAGHVESLLFGHKDTCPSGLGRIVDVVVQHQPPNDGRFVAVVSFTFVSRLPDGAKPSPVSPAPSKVPAQRSARVDPLNGDQHGDRDGSHPGLTV